MPSSWKIIKPHQEPDVDDVSVMCPKPVALDVPVPSVSIVEKVKQ
ncbi:MAG: hypothetical protein QW398_01255 [Desulfurococcaceae archaeon]